MTLGISIMAPTSPCPLFFYGAPVHAGSGRYGYEKSVTFRARELAIAYPGYATAQIIAFIEDVHTTQTRVAQAYKEKEDQRKEQEQRKRDQQAQAAREAEEERVRAWMRWSARMADLIETGPKAHRNSLNAMLQIAYLDFSSRKKLHERSPEEMMAVVIAELEGRDG